jgi:hypothetical protein
MADFSRNSLMLVICFLMAGCGGGRGSGELVSQVDLGPTIGSLVEVFLPEFIPVRGYGVVGGLGTNGSSECPPQVRAYLEQYILKQLPEHRMDIEGFISSADTAVVIVEAMMPTMAAEQYFDVMVTALPGTQTRSLENGLLYPADLKVAGGMVLTMQVLAEAEGPVFIDKIGSSAPDERSGYVLGGGTIQREYEISLLLRQPDYRLSNLIGNRLNERFGKDIARSVSDSQIRLKIPARYRRQKRRFISIVKAMYLSEPVGLTEDRITTFARTLAVSEDKEGSEIALEAIGRASLGKLGVLLKLSDERVRLAAGRCMLNLGSDGGLETLRQIAMNRSSAYRQEALGAITAAADRNDASAISRMLLRDDDFDIRLSAYEQLRVLGDIAVVQNVIGGNFYLEQISQTPHKSIFVSRSGLPSIVLFGSPLYCRDNIFVQSADGTMTINASAGQNYVSIIRKHPVRPDVVIQLKSSFEVGDIIRTLCEEPLGGREQGRLGLNVSYSDAIVLLKQMCEKGAIQAEFRAGDLPKIGPIVKK